MSSKLQNDSSFVRLLAMMANTTLAAVLFHHLPDPSDTPWTVEPFCYECQVCETEPSEKADPLVEDALSPSKVELMQINYLEQAGRSWRDIGSNRNFLNCVFERLI